METTIWPLIASEREGNASADTLFRALYSELHGLAKRELNRKSGLASLSVTTLRPPRRIRRTCHFSPWFPLSSPRLPLPAGMLVTSRSGP